MALTEMKVRVQKRLDALQTNPFEAARKVGLERSFINDILIGRKKTVRDKGLYLLAEALDCDPEYLTGHQSAPRRLAGDLGQGLPISMTCETGAWRPSGGHFTGTTIPVLPDPRYPGVANIAALARGDGAELVGIRDGDIVITLDWAEWSKRFGALRDGSLYVIRRVRLQFDEVEFSIRRAVVTGESAKFVSASERSYPDIELNGSNSERVEVVGVVARSIREFI